MELKKCSCGFVCTTENSKFLGFQVYLENDYGLNFYNCQNCKTTFVIKVPKNNEPKKQGVKNENL